MSSYVSQREDMLERVRSCDLAGRGVQAIVLFGSRAKGTHTANSDWDLAFLVDDPKVDHIIPLQSYWPENPFRDCDNVDACVLNQTYLTAHRGDFG